ncbi:MAG: primosomal protein N' [Oligoflexales bacterium]
MPETFLDIAVSVNLKKTFTYTCSTKVASGCRVLVPFANRVLTGVVLGETKQPAATIRTKAIQSIVDDSPYFRSSLVSIAKWMSDYYIHPIGTTFQTMMPATVQKKKYWSLTEKGKEHISTDPESNLQKIFKKKKQLTHTTFSKHCKDLDSTPEKFERQGLVTKQSFSSIRTKETAASKIELKKEPQKQLTTAQKKAFDAIITAPLKPTLLFGVTGSGKTEIYLQLIQKTLDEDSKSQVLMLVPEISLTPQITQVFENRFPGQVVTTHSRLTETSRLEAIEKIRHGHSSILIGPRSALFAPFLHLKRIIIDEEHDHSYKQNSGLTYHGRDVAVLLSKMENIPMTLGSATPSMESWRNALEGKYNLVSLEERVTQRPLPPIEILDATKAYQMAQTLPQDLQRMQDSWVPLHPEVVEAIEQNHKNDGQTILLVNRRGYAFHLMNPKTKKTIQCPRCSVSLTLHKKNFQLRCHYCDFQQSLAKAREQYGHLIAVGYGSQKVEETLKKSLSPEIRIARLDSDNAKESLTQTLDDFRSRKFDILVGTQLLAKGHDFPQVTLVVLLDINQSLHLPDFRAGERTFQLLVQAAGRAGRGEKEGKVLGQGSAEDPRVQFGLEHNFLDFAALELQFRKAHNYPPYSRLICIELNSENRSLLERHCTAIRSWIDNLEIPETTIVGPTPPAVEKIHHRYRQTLLFSSKHPGYLRRAVLYTLESWPPPSQIRMIVDVDPQDLL